MIAIAKRTRPSQQRLVGHETDSGRLAPAVAKIDMPRIQSAVREILEAIGEDPDREGLQETPARVARAYAEMFAGMTQDAGVHLARQFDQDVDQAIVLRDIPFTSMCEHHLLPFSGKAHIAYAPGNGKVVGLSKLARIVEVYARRPQMQERLTQQICDALEEHLSPRGIAVIVEGTHDCMRLRGVQKQGATMITSAFRGELEADTSERAMVVSMLQPAASFASMRGMTSQCSCDHGDAIGDESWQG